MKFFSKISPRFLEWFALLVILLSGAFLRFYQLEYKSLWIDEIGQVVAAQGGFLQAIQGAVQHVAAPPLDYVVTWLMLQLGRNGIVTSEFVLRFPAVCWGILAIVFGYALAKRITRSKLIALLTAYFIAFAPLLIRFSQEMRFYALSILLSLALVYLFVRAWQKPNGAAWTIFAIVLLLGFFAHYYTVFVLAAILGYTAFDLVFTLWRAKHFQLTIEMRARLGGIGAAVGVFALFAVAWFGYAKPAQAQQMPLLLESLQQVVGEPVTSGHVGAAWHQKAVQILGMYIFPALALLGIVHLARKKNQWSILLALLVLLGAGGVILLDWWFKYFYTSRQLLFVVPFYFVLVAGGLGALYCFCARRSKGFGAAVLLCALSGITFVSLLSARAYYDWPKDDWRSTARLLNNAHAQTILAEPATLETYLTYYEPALANAFNTKFSTHVWLVTLDGYAPHALQDKKWNGVRLDASPPINIVYAGDASENELLRQVAAFDLPPQVLVYSDFLTRLQAVDAALAQSVATRARAELERTQPPLLYGQYTRLLRRLRRAE